MGGSKPPPPFRGPPPPTLSRGGGKTRTTCPRNRLPPRSRFSRLGAGLLAGERAAEALFEAADEGWRAERSAGTFVGADGFALIFAQRSSKEAAPTVHAV